MGLQVAAPYLKGLMMSGSLAEMPRPRKKVVIRTFSMAVAARLRELRDEREWLVEDVIDRIALCGSKYVCRSKNCGKSHVGLTVSQAVKCPFCGSSTKKEKLVVEKRLVFFWEKGKLANGADMPVDYYPIIAAVYGYKYPHEWLPEWTPKFLGD